MPLRPIKLTVGSTPIGKAITWSYPNHDGNTYFTPTYALEVAGTDGRGVAVNKTFEVIRFGVNRKSTTAPASVVGLADVQTYVIKNWLPDYKVHSYPSREDGAWHVFGNYLIHDGPDYPLKEAYATAGCIEICNGPAGFVLFNDFLISISGAAATDRLSSLTEIARGGKMTITYLKASRPLLKLVK